jgi:hypothetical protein
VTKDADDRHHELSVNAVKLARNVAALNASIDGLHRRTARSERVIALTIIGLCLDLALTLIAAFLVWTQFDTTSRVDAVCPLYAVIIGSYNPDTRAAGEARDSYNQAFDIMRDGYARLKCRNPIVPPRVN